MPGELSTFDLQEAPREEVIGVDPSRTGLWGGNGIWGFEDSVFELSCIEGTVRVEASIASDVLTRDQTSPSLGVV